MQRRKFIRNTALGSVALPGIFNGLGVLAHNEHSALSQLLTPGVPNDHILVIIQLSGGNDGVNTVIPLDQYANYLNARANIAIPQNVVLSLNGTAATGLHPALTGFQAMYNNGDLAIVQNAGYAQPNFSHFRATDIFMTASNSNEFITTGWMGRYLNSDFPGFPVGYPNATMPDPLAIQFGSSTSLMLLGPTIQMGYTISDPNAFVNNADGGEDVILPGTPANDKLLYVREISKQSQAYYNAVKNAYNAPGNANLVTYPSGSLANQLKIIARLINGGLKSKVYVATIGGFDTHSGQVNTSDTTTGAHANLLKNLGDSTKAFHDDLKLMNKDGRVLGMTFSEFGRRIRSNASVGTDHGYAAPMFIFGTPANSTIVGPNPNIPANPTVSEGVGMTIDFRDIYWSVLKKWLCQDAPSLNDIMLRPFNEVNICDGTGCGLPNMPVSSKSEPDYVRAYPNPSPDFAVAEFETDGGATSLELMTAQGIRIQNVLQHNYDRPKMIQVKVDMRKLLPGTYYLHFRNGERKQMKPVIKM